MPIPNDSEPYETLDVYTWETANRSPGSGCRTTSSARMTRSNRPPTRCPLSAMVMQTNPKPRARSRRMWRRRKTCPPKSQGALAQVQPTGLYLGGNGAHRRRGGRDLRSGWPAPTPCMPVIRNYEGPIVRSDLLANMLVDNTQRDAHIDNLVNLAVGNLYKGIDIDYRGLDKNLRGEFNQFIKELAEKLHAQGKDLSVRVEPAVQVAEDRWETGPYDWQTLGLLADTVKIPAPVDPNAYVPDGQLDALLRYAVGQINRYKLQVILSGQSIEQAGNYLLQRATPTRSSRCWAAWLPIRPSSSRASR